MEIKQLCDRIINVKCLHYNYLLKHILYQSDELLEIKRIIFFFKQDANGEL